MSTALLDRMKKFKALMESANIKPDEIPMLAYPQSEFGELMKYYVPYRVPEWADNVPDVGTQASVFGYKGIIV